MRTMMLLAWLALGLLSVERTALAEPIHGAGSTFAYPVIAKWFDAYQVEQAGGGDFVSQDKSIDYEPIGARNRFRGKRRTATAG